MSDSRKWVYTLQDIADASGVSIHTVRDHKAQGFLDPDNLASVSQYIVSERTRIHLRSGKDVDEWGEPK